MSREIKLLHTMVFRTNDIVVSWCLAPGERVGVKFRSVSKAKAFYNAVSFSKGPFIKKAESNNGILTWENVIVDFPN